MKEISSLKNSFIKSLIALQNVKTRYQKQQFLVTGWHLVSAALEQKKVVSAVLIDKQQYDKFKNKIMQDIDIYLVSFKIIKKISQTITPQPIVALCNMKQVDTQQVSNVLLLDNIQDPSNLGAIFRNCAAFNIKKIYLSNNSVDLYNHKVISASQGAIFKLQVVYCNLFDQIKQLKLNNYYVFATFLHEKQVSIRLDQVKFKKKNALLFGNESQGIDLKLRPLVNQNFIIKTSSHVESLNLAVSVAITSYCLFNSNIIK